MSRTFYQGAGRCSFFVSFFAAHQGLSAHTARMSFGSPKHCGTATFPLVGLLGHRRARGCPTWMAGLRVLPFCMNEFLSMRQSRLLLDHLIGECKKIRRQFNARGLCDFEVDDACSALALRTADQPAARRRDSTRTSPAPRLIAA